jgi:hypothetical protein
VFIMNPTDRSCNYPANEPYISMLLLVDNHPTIKRNKMAWHLFFLYIYHLVNDRLSEQLTSETFIQRNSGDDHILQLSLRVSKIEDGHVEFIFLNITFLL